MKFIAALFLSVACIGCPSTVAMVAPQDLKDSVMSQTELIRAAHAAVVEGQYTMEQVAALLEADLRAWEALDRILNPGDYIAAEGDE